MIPFKHIYKCSAASDLRRQKELIYAGVRQQAVVVEGDILQVACNITLH